MARRLEVDPESLATVTFTWTEDRRQRTAEVRIAAEGIELDRVVDLLVAGFEASADPVYTATVGEIVERVTRTRRPPFPKPTRPGPPDGAIGAPVITPLNAAGPGRSPGPAAPTGTTALDSGQNGSK